MGTTAATVRKTSQQPIPHVAELLQRLADARARTDELFGIVRPEALYDRPIAERHRIIFYTGHLEAFDWNLLGRGHFDLPAFDAAFDQLFAFGIDPVGGGLPTDVPADWPRRARVDAYNRRLRGALDERLASSRDSFAEPDAQMARLLNVAIEHRLMHAETLAYMLHQLPIDRKIPHADSPAPAAMRVEPRMLRVPAGLATLGLRRSDGEYFGWDNEFEEHRVAVPEFSIDAYKVTNGAYLKFVESAGYQDRSLWKDADLDWLQSRGTLWPAFWALHGERVFLRTMFDEIPLPLDWPVYVSHAEASAYARWSGKELPSEAEWHRAAYGTNDGVERPYPWGSEPPSPSHGNFDFQRWDPVPVTTFPDGRSF